MLEILLAFIAAVSQMHPAPAGGSVSKLAVPPLAAQATPLPHRLFPTTQAPMANVSFRPPASGGSLGAKPTPVPTPTSTRKVVNGRVYDAYNQAAVKNGQWYHYTCEFDAAWIVLKTFGHDVKLAEMLDIVGLADGPEPYYKETTNGVVIYGGDIFTAYSGDYKKNFLARSTGLAMSKLFEHYDLKVTPVHDREGIEAALRRGEVIWIKTTVDFKDWVPATWVLPDGRTYKTVLGNDHSNVVIGYNKDVVVIQDPLGPTSTGRNRPLQYEVPWSKFLRAWGAQQYDGLAVGK